MSCVVVSKKSKEQEKKSTANYYSTSLLAKITCSFIRVFQQISWALKVCMATDLEYTSSSQRENLDTKFVMLFSERGRERERERERE